MADAALPQTLSGSAAAAPQIMAAVRNLAHTLIRRPSATAIATARRSFSYRPARAPCLLPAVP